MGTSQEVFGLLASGLVAANTVAFNPSLIQKAKAGTEANGLPNEP